MLMQEIYFGFWSLCAMLELNQLILGV